MNRYKELKTLGKGSFGRAILVQEISTGKQYVMKVIQISSMKPQEREDALQEARILEQLQHQNITAYKESFSDQRFLYIVMEFANGGDLYGAIKAQKMKGKLFEEEQIMDYFVQISLGLKHIHDRKILHRDLKTQNIFINVMNGRKYVKIGDFGVSKVLSSTLECAKTAIGTPYYLSPELCNNQGYNNKSDIWALGCILYEICTLNHTFEAANMKMLIVKILEGKYTPISSRYSVNLKNLITAMLQKDPKRRPSINQILKSDLMMPLVQKWLSQDDILQEFPSMMPQDLQKLKQQTTQDDSKSSSNSRAKPQVNVVNVQQLPNAIQKPNVFKTQTANNQAPLTRAADVEQKIRNQYGQFQQGQQQRSDLQIESQQQNVVFQQIQAVKPKKPANKSGQVQPPQQLQQAPDLYAQVQEVQIQPTRPVIKTNLFPVQPKKALPEAQEPDEDDQSFGDQPAVALQQIDNKAVNVAQQLQQKLQNEKESLCYRVESLKAFLEKELGFETFVKSYMLVQSACENDNENLDQEAMLKFLGEDRMGFINVMVQLFLVEQRFNEQQE